MPFPWTWNPTSPNAATDKVSQFPSMSFYHGDKTTLKDILPLTDLASPSTATFGWRVRQIGNVVWMTANAAYDAGSAVWNRDDTTKPTFAIVYDIPSDILRIMQAPSGANPISWSESARFYWGSIETSWKVATSLFEGKPVTLTTDIKALSLIPTWNNAGVTFTGIHLNVTDTASAAASLLMDLQVGGVSRFSVTKAGHIATASTDVVTNLNADTVDGLHKAGLSSKRRVAILVIPGNPAAGAGLSIRLIMPVAGTITAIRSTCRVGPASTYTYDINKNGTTIYTTQTNRPTRTADDGINAVTHAMPDITTFVAGDIFTVDLDVAGTGISDVTFFIEFDETGQ